MGGTRPSSLVRAFASLGPGLVVAGSVLGSGELINTPAQAAKFGFILLWAVLLSCVIKYVLQIEIARYCLVTNRTTVEALNQCPGPKFRGTSWTAILYMLGYFATMATVIGIIGALGGLMHGVWPLAATAERSVLISISSLRWGRTRRAPGPPAVARRATGRVRARRGASGRVRCFRTGPGSCLRRTLRCPCAG